MLSQDTTEVIPLNRQLVRWDPKIAKFFCRFNLLTLFITHFRRPFTTDAPNAQTPNLIRTTSPCNPNETRGSKIRKGVLWTLLQRMQFVLAERTGSPDQLEPGIFLDIPRIWLNG